MVLHEEKHLFTTYICKFCKFSAFHSTTNAYASTH